MFHIIYDRGQLDYFFSDMAFIHSYDYTGLPRSKKFELRQMAEQLTQPVVLLVESPKHLDPFAMPSVSSNTNDLINNFYNIQNSFRKLQDQLSLTNTSYEKIYLDRDAAALLKLHL